MGFTHDMPKDRPAIRVFALVDLCTRECIVLHGAGRFKGSDVATFLSAAVVRCGRLRAGCHVTTARIYVDRFGSLGLVEPGPAGLLTSRPAGDSSVCEAFNGSLRRECHSMNWFADLVEAEQTLNAWQKVYTDHRPHGGLRKQRPSEFKKAATITHDRCEPVPDLQAGSCRGRGAPRAERVHLAYRLVRSLGRRSSQPTLRRGRSGSLVSGASLAGVVLVHLLR